MTDPIHDNATSPRQTGAGVEWVAASDIGSHVYCARMYWLSKVQKVRPDTAARARLRAGRKNHARHGKVYDVQRKARRTATWAIGLAALLATSILLLSRLI